MSWPHRIPREFWTYGIKPAQVFISTPTTPRRSQGTCQAPTKGPREQGRARSAFPRGHWKRTWLLEPPRERLRGDRDVGFDHNGFVGGVGFYRRCWHVPCA
ncbi:hypothetical protein ABIC42_005319 [Variovorax sp. 1133]